MVQRKAEAATTAGELPAELHISVPLWSLADLRSARSESELLDGLDALSWTCAMALDGVMPPLQSAALAARADAFAELVTGQCSRSPLDAAAAQTLAWRLEGNSGSGWMAGT